MSSRCSLTRTAPSRSSTGRLKNIFKLAHGEYIAPEKTEIVYVQASSVAQAFVYGTSTERFLAAVVVPSDEGVRAFAEKTGKPRDMN
uniref:AMP-binding enzyme C-terminal domain-containing protein n=1 Tax=Chromera velia CCMP2878 TaxID=1169474 RepID=A0A0G4F952_9ALVE|eukprot:Cvel_2948.t1-p1 / transcript=Cvel_2948.t1 / gene=Cvel_2948 / organism=Chromera_velia_CCMP2878 / gene_product=Long-chain-fatty-acid--CoA ligase 1, putative / transcript_product=Long-chain-fatty-acid--CoA ligase 1, putative / location=Cvel_scaffold116:100563-101583(+) / protein_length=86 / sequence_SO=supercontig / SO=protein_coding / is_pseudo=false